MMERIQLVEPNSKHMFVVKESEEGQRLDLYLSNQFPSYSRSYFGGLIGHNRVKLNEKTVCKKGTPLRPNDKILVTFPKLKKDPAIIKEGVEKLNIQLVHENPHFLILNKPHNLLVHAPHPQSTAITMVDWLIAKFEEIKHVGYGDKPGIVHRLDKNTTGLLIVTRNNCSHAYFSYLFKERKIKKRYLAIVKGHPEKEGEINLDLARHPTIRNKMTHVTSGNIPQIRGRIRQSKTIYKVREYFDNCSLVEVYPVTGRTHQIRVHFSAIGHPLIGDPVYGEKSKIIDRQALHANKLEFVFEDETYQFEQNIPDDFQDALCHLQKNKTEIFS